MELDFDKEIDALIRREAAGRTITISERSGLHLDADEIAAFAEGVVPERARQTFILHFSECDPCRKTLATAAALQAEEASEAAKGVAAPAAETATVPWYKRLFLFPNLAYVMGGLVVLFAGFIGLSVLTGTYRSGESDVSRAPSVQQSDIPASEASSEGMSQFANTNSLAVSNPASNAANTAANVPYGQAAPVPAANAASNTAAAKDAPITAPADEEAKSKEVQVTAAPPPAPASRNENFTIDGVATKRVQETRPAQAPERDNKAESKVVPQATPMPRSGPMPKLKGPVRNDARERNLALEAEKARVMKKTDAGSSADISAATSGRKNVSGRTFEFRQGAWYDTTYRGQGTVNVRRNTDDYRKLDGGLRGIAESFIGTVVVTIWNGRAYRIQ